MSKKSLSLFVILFASFVDYAGIALIYPLITHLLFDKRFSFIPVGVSDAHRGLWLGILLGLYPLMQFITCPIFGTLSDIKGRRPILLLSLWIGLIGYLFSLLAIVKESLFWIVIYRILVGISGGNVAIASAVVADISTTENKAKNYGLLSMVFGAGFTFGPFLGGWLCGPFTEKCASAFWPFIVANFFVVINLLLVIFLFSETNLISSKKRLKVLSCLYQLKKALIERDLRILFVPLFLVTAGWAFFGEFIPLFLIERFNFTPKHLGYYFGYTGVCYAFSAGVLIRFAMRWFSLNRLLLISFYLAGLAALSFYWIDNPLFLLFFVPLSQFFLAFIYPVISTLVSNSVSNEIQGEALGMYQSIISFGLAISPLIAGPLIGMYPALSVLLGAGCILAAGLIYQAMTRLNFKADR